MTLVDWWALAQVDASAAASAWRSLSPADRKAIRGGVERARRTDGLLADVRELVARIGAVVEEATLDALVESWPSADGLSTHLNLELAASQHWGRPLQPGEPVPGCGCPECTGLAADHPARVPVWQRRLQERRLQARQRTADGRDPEDERRDDWRRRVDQARAIPITRIAQQLGLGVPEGRGKEVRVRCPFHDDEHPSLSLNEAKGLWYCPVCGEGGDGLNLYMRVQEESFAGAVRALTP